MLTAAIQELLSEALQVSVESVPPDMSFGDVPQWDSMGHMEVMLLLEQRYGVEINAETIAALTNIPAICNYLKDNGHA
jgi:acyl carrier protein